MYGLIVRTVRSNHRKGSLDWYPGSLFCIQAIGIDRVTGSMGSLTIESGLRAWPSPLVMLLHGDARRLLSGVHPLGCNFGMEAVHAQGTAGGRSSAARTPDLHSGNADSTSAVSTISAAIAQW